MTTTITDPVVDPRIERERARKRRYQYRIQYVREANGQVRAYVPEVGPFGTIVGAYRGTKGFVPFFSPTVFKFNSTVIGEPCDRPSSGCASYHSILAEIVRVNNLKGTTQQDDRETYEVPEGATFETTGDDPRCVWVVSGGRCVCVGHQGGVDQFNLTRGISHLPQASYPAISKEEAEKRLGRRIVFVRGGVR